MEANKNKEKPVDTEELKKETVNTVNQVKDTIKNVDIKKDAKEATGFAASMFKDPFGTIKKIAVDSTNKTFKTAIIFLIVWVLAKFIHEVLGIILGQYWDGTLGFTRMLNIFKVTFAPILTVLILSVIAYLMNKENQKTLVTTITAITIAKIPVILAQVVSLITLISSNASTLTSRFSEFCSIVSIILTYFSMKSLFGEEQNSKFFKKFVGIYAIYYVISLVAYFLGIYI